MVVNHQRLRRSSRSPSISEYRAQWRDHRCLLQSGKNLQKNDISSLVINSLKIFPKDPKAIYLVLTAANVSVDGFCRSTCGDHFYTYPSFHSAGQMLPYAWVGNSETQCTGFCAWPYAKPDFGPNTEPLLAPNGVGVDGMIITIAKVLAGAATNPYGNAYYQGDASAALEAAGACSRSYSPGAYPGYPGDLLKDVKTGASYNVGGVMERKFLVPWMWNPITLACAGQPQRKHLFSHPIMHKLGGLNRSLRQAALC
ncbi:hypothetical protein O6H91_16G011000 [Diphasiastrum complanatum]|uniref:Uncharacterized protein n=1 Tax=Diphasiastrum complanatum TaxID=34168 RepID=A0ACC2B9Y7_DIPCM|nr:hypothetical protein O6H91_16G011000 [Diphasiastrum complanatum]